MVKIILFDFWGTLADTGVKSPIKQVKEILGISLPFSEYVLRMEKVMMTKTFPSLREAFEAVAQEFRVQASSEQIDELVGMWNKSWMLSKPYEETQMVLVDLKRDYKLVLLANTDCFSVEKVLDKFSLRPLFDGMYLSYTTGTLKSEKESFDKILQELGACAQECIMVGDSIESDILPAQRAGIRAVLVDRRAYRDFEPKIENLHKLKVMLER